MFSNLTRRTALGILAAGAALAAALRPAFARIRTPEQMAGPFYPPPSDRFDDTDADLVKIESEVRTAGGEVLHLSGQVLGPDGPVLGAVVEIWQCDANGRYLHSRDPGRVPRDPAFQGYGFLATGADGRYAFRTIRPVPYPGRTPHIHVRVTPPQGRVLTSQLYVEDEALNPGDFIYAGLSSEDRKAVTMRLARRDDGDLQTVVDLVL